MNRKGKLNILVLSSWFPWEESKWSGDFVQRHAKAIATIHHVTVIYAVGSHQVSTIQQNIYEEKNYKEVIIIFPKSKFKILNGIKKWRLYLKEIAKLPRFDLIHANVTFPIGLFVLFLKKIKNYRYVITEHWTGYLPQDPAKISFIEKFLTRKIINNASYILPVSESLGKALQNFGKIQKLKVVRNVVDMNVFKFLPDHRNEIFAFLHISNLTFQKNVDGMLNAALRLWEEGFDFKFKIGGNGDLSPLISFQKKNNLGNKLELFGSLTSMEVAQKMQESDCFVLFSRFENQPCVQNESFATGLPIIASDVGGISELFPSGFGNLVASENENQLYKAMKSVLINRDFADKTTINKFANQHFSVSEIAKQFDEVYLEILSEP